MGSSLTVALGMILLGAAMLYAGWTGRALRKVLTGDNSRPAAKEATAK